MALISAGTSVTVIDESFFIPAAAPTVPLFFIATRGGKFQPNGVTLASGTTEHSVVRTVTSIGQSTQLYGIPYFKNNSSGEEYHGDARNEYGLFALNQFLGIGNRAYVVRANVDLTDAAESFVSAGAPRAIANATLFGTGNGTVTGLNGTGRPTAPNNTVRPQSITVRMVSPTSYTVIGSVAGIIGAGTVGTNFNSNTVQLRVNAGSTAFVTGDEFIFNLVYVPTTTTAAGNGTMTSISTDVYADEFNQVEVWTISFTSATTYDVFGSVHGATASGVVGVAYDNNFINFIINAGTTPFQAGDEFTINLTPVESGEPLGSDDAAKRVAIVAALQSAINSNTEVRSEIYEYNLIVCPGYPEVVDELVALSNSINDEAFVIADTPMNKNPEQTAVWSMTAERVSSQNVAYYYPWGVASNLDGRNVFVAPSGIALRTYAYSDNQSYLWYAPAGINRGSVTGVTSVGYVTGTLGTPTTFVETNLNQGQRDALYEYFKNINPIVFFPGRGLIVWGQKTSQGSASALDRVNAMRAVMYIKRQLRKNSFPFIFEPNDSITRANLKAAADGLLNDILAKRGLYDFVTLCDESNNTPDRIDRNEMYLDVGLKLVKAAEFLYIPIRIFSTGAQLPS